MPEKMRAICKKPAYLALALLLVLAMLALTFLEGDQANVQTDLESRLEAILGCVEGAGKVRVLIHNGEQEAVSVWSAGLQPQADGEIIGVLIVAQGAGDAAVSAKLAQAAGSALGVDQSRIEVFRMESR